MRELELVGLTLTGVEKVTGTPENPEKHSQKRPLLMVATGIAACALGAFIGSAFTTWQTGPESVSSEEMSDFIQDSGADDALRSLNKEAIAPGEDGFVNINEVETSEAANVADSVSKTDSPEPSLNDAATSTQTRNSSANTPVDSFASEESPLETAALDTAFGQSPFQVDSRERQVTLADEELRTGNYDRATRIYSAVLTGATGIQEAAIRFRLALTMESLGEFKTAMKEYQSLVADFPELSWSTAARLGEARCAAALGQIDEMAEKILRFIVLDETQVGQRVRGEFLHIAGRAIGHQTLDVSKDGLLASDVLFLPPWLVDPNRELLLLRTLLKDEPTLKQREQSFKIVQQSDNTPADTFIQAFTEKLNLRMLLNLVCGRSGFELDVSDAAAQRLADRSQQLRVEDISVSLLLDGFCAPFGLMWYHDHDGVHIRAHEEVAASKVQSYREDFGVRLLKSALVIAPESHRVDHSRMALGVLQHQAGQKIEAAYTFKTQLSGTLPTSLYAEAALNLGKCRMALGQFPEAREAFLLAVDSGSKNVRASTAAYLFYARMLIEAGESDLAVASLFRALTLCRGTEFESMTALMLASAYLMNGNPKGASDVLMERREAMADESLKAASAFISALAQFRSTVLAGRRERAAKTLVTALSQLDAGKQFGAHWSYLRAEACDEVGLTKAAMDSYTETIKRLPAAELRGRALLKLSNHFRFEGRLAEAAELLTVVSGQGKDVFGRQIALQSALIALKRGQPEVTIEHCRFIIENEDDPDLQRTALQTMGQAYEQMDDHQSAVYCFAGMLPASKRRPTPSVEESPVNENIEDASRRRDLR